MPDPAERRDGETPRDQARREIEEAARDVVRAFARGPAVLAIHHSVALGRLGVRLAALESMAGNRPGRPGMRQRRY